MKAFLVKIFWFSSPILLLAVYTYRFYSMDTGDLIRLGYIIDLFPNYKSVFKGMSPQESKFARTLEFPKGKKFTVLTVGDSFSGLGPVGYNNYLGEKDNISVLHFDDVLSGNPIENLFTLSNGDFFEKYKFDFVILECVERNLITNIESITTNKEVTNLQLDSLLKGRVGRVQKQTDMSLNLDFKFHSNRIIKFPYNTAWYYLTNTFLFDRNVYKTRISNRMFSVENQNLLFLYHDVILAEKNNVTDNVTKLNSILNMLNDRLETKGIKLIVLPAPDKYDIYYEYIVDKNGFPKPVFFSKLAKMNKKYIYTDSKKILSEALVHTKDIYLYDDSHWSPRAAKLIANELEKQMRPD